MSIEGVSLEKGEQRMGYSNLKKFRNKIDYFNKKIKEVLLVNKKFKKLLVYGMVNSRQSTDHSTFS